MIAAAVAAAALAFAPGTTESFEQRTVLPSDWTVDEYEKGASTAALKRGKAPDGKVFLRIVAEKPNHTRVLIPAKVEPGATYRLSAQVRARGKRQFPAVLGLLGSATTSKRVAGDATWREQDLYFQPGTASEVSLMVSLGWFYDTVAGTADFDVLSLQKVDAAPAGAAVATIDGQSSAAPGSGEAKAEIPGPNALTIPLAILMAVIAAGCAVVLKRADRVR